MNICTLIGRIVRDPEIRYTQGDNPMAVARYTLAVQRNRKNSEGKYDSDFISCVAYGKSAEFTERYLHKGSKIAVSGRITTGSYTNKEGQKVYTTDVVIDNQEFAESKDGQQEQKPQQKPQSNVVEGFMAIPEDVDGPGLPWN